MLKGILRDKNPFIRSLYLVGLAFFGASFCSSIGMLLIDALSSVDLLDNLDRLTAFDELPGMLNAYRWLLFFQHSGMFILPALLYPYLLGENRRDFLGFHGIDAERVFFTLLLMLFFLPLSNFLAQLNSGLELPESLGWLERKFQNWEEQARSLTHQLLSAEAWPGLLRNLFLLAVLPAVGEEMLFRGALQRTLARMSGNVHVAIWIAAALFSAMHTQFYGFLPRLALGALFGYLLVWTGTIWVPILGHFVNNAAAVFFSYLVTEKGLAKKYEEAGGQEGQAFVVLICGSIVAWLLLYAKRRFSKEALKDPKAPPKDLSH